MNCLHPVRLFDTGLKTDKGKPVYFFDRSGADRISPQQCQKRGYPVSYWLDKYIEVPCGTCVACRENRTRQWAFRMACELVTTKSKNLDSYFLTLTYDDEHLPSDGKISKVDLVNFNKRLRASVGPFRFFACGEYGDAYGRPHYHGIYFGLMLSDVSYYKGKGCYSLYESATLSRAWGKGLVLAGSVEMESAAYVAGYVDKKAGHRDCFQLMSRRPGIGFEYLKKYPAFSRVVIPTKPGSIAIGAVPRSAYPDAVRSDKNFVYIGEVAQCILNGYDKNHLEDYRWLMDYALNHPLKKGLT